MCVLNRVSYIRVCTLSFHFLFISLTSGIFVKTEERKRCLCWNSRYNLVLFTASLTFISGRSPKLNATIYVLLENLTLPFSTVWLIQGSLFFIYITLRVLLLVRYVYITVPLLPIKKKHPKLQERKPKKSILDPKKKKTPKEDFANCKQFTSLNKAPNEEQAVKHTWLYCIKF